MKKILLSLSLCWVLIFSFSLPAFAATSIEDVIEEEVVSIQYFEDGSYIVTTIYTQSLVIDGLQRVGNSQQVRGGKTDEYYNASHEKVWSYGVAGLFTYDGVNEAVCIETTDLPLLWGVYEDLWMCADHVSFRTGNRAMGHAEFCLIAYQNNIYESNVTVTCDKNGNIS